MVSTAVDVSALARTVAIETRFKDLSAGNIRFLPQSLAVVGQGSTLSTYDTTKFQVSSAQQVGEMYGFGSPLHLSVLQLLPINGDGVGTIPVVVYPLEDPSGGAISEGDITPSGSATGQGTFVVRINNIDSEAFLIELGDSVSDIVAKMTESVNSSLNVPVIATDESTEVTFDSKWQGQSSNNITLEVIGSDDIGVSFDIVDMTGGTGTPLVASALSQVGDVWVTMMLNCLDISSTTTLDEYSTFGEGRWGSLVNKPLVVFTGSNEPDVSTATTIPDSRKTDRTNSQLIAPGSKDLPFSIAARQLARIVKRANNDPAFDYGSLQADGLAPGSDGVQWDYAERDQAIKKGSSSTQVRDGVINISDTITFYHPTGQVTPLFRYVVDIVKIQTLIHNINLIFQTDEWDGAPLIPDDQPTVNPNAKQPKMAKAEIALMLDNAGLNAIISDPETAKKRTQAGINVSNPKRLDINVVVQISGNSNIVALSLDLGFFFGSAQVLT